MEAHAQEFMRALEAQDVQRFAQAEDHLKASAFDHAFGLRNNAGLVDQEGYQPPALVEQFITTDQGRLYIQEVRESLEQNNWSIDPVHQRAIHNLIEQAERGLNQSQGGMCICRVLGIGAGVSRECFGP